MPEDDSKDELDDPYDVSESLSFKSLRGLAKIPKVQWITSSKRFVTSHQYPSENAGSRLVKLFDLDLLEDLRFLSIVFGSLLVLFAETNFSLRSTLMLTELYFNTGLVWLFRPTFRWTG